MSQMKQHAEGQATDGKSMELLSESLPSTKHREVEEPGRALRRRAADPPRPVLPKSHGPRTWKGTARERDPLASSLTGG
jgi:hypothetical protein